MEVVARAVEVEQRSEEWYRIRQDLLTASACVDVLEQNPFNRDSRAKVLSEKVTGERSPVNEIHTRHGTLFEPVATRLYERHFGVTVQNVGIVLHKTVPFLGASPDGVVVESARLLEIKCPATRRITGKVPPYYWAQVQLQLEVCDVEECDFWECRFQVVQDEAEWERFEPAVPGVDPLLQKGVLEDGTKWVLLATSCNLVRRDRAWFEEARPKLERFWKEVEFYRARGFSFDTAGEVFEL